MTSKVYFKPYYILQQHIVVVFIFIHMLLVWDVIGKVMGVVWGVANFTALLLFFFLG